MKATHHFGRVCLVTITAIPACLGVVDLGRAIAPEVGYISGLGSRDQALSGVGGGCQMTVVLRAKLGQRWNISLLDFSAVRPVQPGGGAATGSAMATVEPSSTRCLRHALISEGDGDQRQATGSRQHKDSALVCGGVEFRERSVYLSETETIRIDVFGRRKADDVDAASDSSAQYMIKFNGKL
jgi:hypothetical protein